MSRLPTGIDRLASGRYRARVHVGGGRYRSKSFSRRSDALVWRQKMLIAKDNGTLASAENENQTLAELAADYMQAKRPDLADKTYGTYRALWRTHVHSHQIAAMAVADIDVPTIEGLKADLLAKTGAAATRTTLMLVQAVLERAVALGRIPSNPARYVKKPSNKRQATIRVVTPLEVERIRAHLRGSDAVLVAVLAYTGMRPGEARALKWGDVGERTIRIERAASGRSIGPTKTGAARSVRLLAPLREDLKKWRSASGHPADDALIFSRQDGSPWSDDDWKNFRNRRFRTAAEKGGSPIRNPYDLRHSAASLWLHEGINAIQVAQWMGHAPTMLPGTYAHVLADLDPADQTPAVEHIRAARRDIPVT